MIRTRRIQVPGRTIEWAIPIGQNAPCPDCRPAPLGLYWFSDATGDFTEVSEAAYLLDSGPAGPALGVARVLGETCGQTVWTTEWSPQAGSGGAPGLFEDGDNLIVYPLPDTQPGILSVSAQCGERFLGPVLLTVLRYQCGYSYCDCAPGCGTFDPLTWDGTSTEIVQASDGSGLYLVMTAFPVIAVVTGSWPAGTAFAWTAEWAPGDTIILTWTERENALAFSPNGEPFANPGDVYTCTVSVIATPPGCDPVPLGPVTLRLESQGS